MFGIGLKMQFFLIVCHIKKFVFVFVPIFD